MSQSPGAIPTSLSELLLIQVQVRWALSSPSGANRHLLSWTTQPPASPTPALTAQPPRCREHPPAEGSENLTASIGPMPLHPCHGLSAPQRRPKPPPAASRDPPSLKANPSPPFLSPYMASFQFSRALSPSGSAEPFPGLEHRPFSGRLVTLERRAHRGLP